MQFEGELYLLATDQGYISQPDLVWEKLDEVCIFLMLYGVGFKNIADKNYLVFSCCVESEIGPLLEMLVLLFGCGSQVV